MANDTLTDFLRHPNRVLKQVDRQDVILGRRGKPSIVISLHLRNAKVVQRNELASGLLADAVAALPEITARLPAILEKRFPWVRFLPMAERGQFAQELVETIEASASLGTSAPIEDLIRSWKTSAGIHADPELASRLSEPVDETPKRVRRP